MQNRKGRRPERTGNVVDGNLKALRERREFLKKEIPRLLFAGYRGTADGGSVQGRSLTADERETVIALRQELKDIESTFRAFGL